MKFGRYGELLRQPGVAPLLLVGMVARLPHAAVGMLLLLHLVNELDRDWGSAGLVVALMTIGIALGAPWRGRVVDMYGLRRALLPSIIVEAVVWSIVPQVSFAWVLPLVFLGGLFSLPVFSVVRTALGVMTTGETRRSAFALDAMATELVFIVGPATAGIVATSLSTTIGMIGIAVAASLSGLVLMILNPPTRSGQPGAVAKKANPHEERLAAEASLIASGPGGLANVEGELILAGSKSTQARVAARGKAFRNKFGWVSASVIAVFIAASGAGLVLSGTEVGMLSLLDEKNSSGQLGIVFFFWCGASLVGGLIYGSLSRRISPIVLLLAMAVLTLPMAFATDTWSLALLSIPPGMLCAPVLSAASEWLTDLVAEKRRGEAMGWYGSALTSGTALGSPITGATVDALGFAAAFIAVGCIGAAVSVAALVAQQVRRRRRARVRTLVSEIVGAQGQEKSAGPVSLETGPALFLEDGAEVLVHRAGELFARALARFVLDEGRFAECELQRAQSVAQRSCVLGTDLRRCGDDQAGQCGDQLAGLVEVFQFFGVVACGKAALDGGGAHQVDGGGGDDFNGCHFGDVANLVGGVRIGFRSTHDAKLSIDRLNLCIW